MFPQKQRRIFKVIIGLKTQPVIHTFLTQYGKLMKIRISKDKELIQSDSKPRHPKFFWQQCRHRSNCSKQNSLIRVFTVCLYYLDVFCMVKPTDYLYLQHCSCLNV